MTKLEDIRRNLDPNEHYIVLRDGTKAWQLKPGWTRIGRSSAADIKLDDPSVGRRHALIVMEPGHRVRILDDRSLNGIYVDGDPVEWASLRNGSLVQIGRYELIHLGPGEIEVKDPPAIYEEPRGL